MSHSFLLKKFESIDEKCCQQTHFKNQQPVLTTDSLRPIAVEEARRASTNQPAAVTTSIPHSFIAPTEIMHQCS